MRHVKLRSGTATDVASLSGLIQTLPSEQIKPLRLARMSISMKLKDELAIIVRSPKGARVTLSSCRRTLRTISNEESEHVSARLGFEKRLHVSVFPPESADTYAA
jgi:hypothetical protein